MVFPPPNWQTPYHNKTQTINSLTTTKTYERIVESNEETGMMMKHTFVIDSDTLTTWLMKKNENLISVVEGVIDDKDSLEKDLTLLVINAKMMLLEELTDLICAQGVGTLH